MVAVVSGIFECEKHLRSGNPPCFNSAQHWKLSGKGYLRGGKKLRLVGEKVFQLRQKYVFSSRRETNRFQCMGTMFPGLPFGNAWKRIVLTKQFNSDPVELGELHVNVFMSATFRRAAGIVQSRYLVRASMSVDSLFSFFKSRRVNKTAILLQMIRWSPPPPVNQNQLKC